MVIYTDAVKYKKRMKDNGLQLLMGEPLALSEPRIRDLVRPRISQPTLWRILDSLRTDGRITVEGRASATRS